LEEKEEKRKTLQLIEQKRYALEQLEQNLAQERYALEEQKRQIMQVEELIPSAKQLKDIGIGFDQAIVWIDCIKEKAEIERIDLRTATWKLAQDLRAYRDLGGLSKAIQDATQQLAMLNMVNEQQKQAIASLVDLRNAGFSERLQS
jgi:soluble cytochrome b562